ncbi:predicted protein, partial [Nematostella vectensis]
MDTVKELQEISEELQDIEVQIESLLERQQFLLSRKQELEVIALSNSNDSVLLSFSSNVACAQGSDWSSTAFSWSQEVEAALKNVFKIDTFRHLQLECINATMSGVDCILIMPTGGGKSLCFQLPAVVSKGLTLVVSPLVSLMEDQLWALKRLGIKAALLNASSTREEVNSVHASIVDKKSDLKMLYVTPEKIAKSKRFMAKLEKSYESGLLSRIVIDEVHCTSQWGHDFRPDYKILGILKRQYPGVPILGLTATATTKVIEDVKKILGLHANCLLLKASFNRPNLFYEVQSKPTTNSAFMSTIHQLITKRFSGDSGIIYCFSRKDAEQVAIEMSSRGIKAACYHADMPPESRSQVHMAWTTNKLQVVVATVAFGMGIDKSNVRFVIHHSFSKSMENYYQESGRAGRDEKRASCIVFYRPFDIFRHSTMVFTEQTGLQNLYGIVRYCQQQGVCRRTLIGRHFGEGWDPAQCKQMCDNCSRRDDERGLNELHDITQYASDLLKILEQAKAAGDRVTANKLVDAWCGRGAVSLRVRGVSAPSLTPSECERVVVHLVVEGVLREEFHFTPYSTISYIVKGANAGML